MIQIVLYSSVVWITISLILSKKQFSKILWLLKVEICIYTQTITYVWILICKYDIKHWSNWQQMLLRLWRNRNPHLLLARMQSQAAILWIDMEIFKKSKSKSTIWLLAYAQRTQPTAPQILAQQCPLLLYSQ